MDTDHHRRRGRLALTVAGALVLALAACVPPQTRPPTPPPEISPVEARLLSVRPEVGPTWVVDPTGLDLGERHLLASLQGLVNRSSARIFVLHRDADRKWIGEYEQRGLVDVVGRTDLEGALERFAEEATGFVLASTDEPWSVNAAVTLAANEGALVATPSTRPLLEHRGLDLVEDVRGDWSDHASAAEAVIDRVGDELAFPSAAILRPTDLLYDFAYQQGMAIVFGRPFQPGWDRTLAQIRRFPGGRAVYGYHADDGIEEASAIRQLSDWGHVLIPSDTTANLSFHIAVAADRPRVQLPAPATAGVARCTPDTVNVVVAISDGDNLALPSNVYRDPRQWDSPERGRLPLGWSVTPALAVLAPAVWDHFARTVAPSDEVVAMIGWGYASAERLPDPAVFYRTSFDLADQLGMESFWSFATDLRDGRAALIDDAAGAADRPKAVLDGYGINDVLGLPSVGTTPGGRPILASNLSIYTDRPADIAAKIELLLALPAFLRPPVQFFSAAVWNNDATGLVEQLRPLQDRGVRFLTPAAAAACLAAPET